MANILRISVPNPDELLNANLYGAGALIRVERSATGGSGYSEIGTTAIVAATYIYVYDDSAGTSTSWYRTRYSNVGNTIQSDYSAEFQVVSVPTGYCTLTDLKGRLGIPDTDTTDDATLLTIIGQVGGLIESMTGRILRPIPAFSTTTSAQWAAGATSGTLTSAAGLSVGDIIMFGPVSGTHEHAIVAAISGTTVTIQSAIASTYASSTAVARVQLFDGFDALENARMVPVPNGIVTATSLEVAFYTGASYNLIPATDWFLRPNPLEREPGWPATELWMTDIPSSSNPAPMFFKGFGNIRVVGSFGWPAIPLEIADIALTTATRAWLGRQAGQQDVVGTDTLGRPVISRYLSGRDRDTLDRYRSKGVYIV